MPKRIIPTNARNRKSNSSENTKRKAPKKIVKLNDVKKPIKVYRANGGKNIRKFNIKNIDFNNIQIPKKTLVTGMTIAVTSAVGIFAINSVVDRGENVEAIEQVVLPERKMAGVNKEGQKYADDAKVVMQKLRDCQYRNDGKRVVYLTFDDGPSNSSNKIMDVLDKYNVKATFFVTGQSIERSGNTGKKILNRMYESGNAIANHSYSHDYNVLYPDSKLNLEAFLADFNKTNELLKNVLGDDFYTNVLRCPGGHMSWNGMEELDSYLNENNMSSIDWNALIGDSVSKIQTEDDLFNTVVETSKGKEMIVLLMHDASSKESTVKALPKIIEYYKSKGYEFRTLS